MYWAEFANSRFFQSVARSSSPADPRAGPDEEQVAEKCPWRETNRSDLVAYKRKGKPIAKAKDIAIGEEATRQSFARYIML
jgi:hypothetical protein